MGFETFAEKKNENTEIFHTKLLERVRRLLNVEEKKTNANRLLKACTLAALTAVAVCTQEVQAQEQERDSRPQTSESQNQDDGAVDAYFASKLRQIQLERSERLETEQQVFDLAEKMGIEVSKDNFQFRQEGLVITEINGIEVPEELHSEEERQRIEYARQIRGEVETNNKSHNWTEESPDIGDPLDF